MRPKWEITGCAVVGTSAVGGAPSLCLEVRRADGVTTVWSGQKWSRANKLPPSTWPVVVRERGWGDTPQFGDNVRAVNDDGELEPSSHSLTRQDSRLSFVVTLREEESRGTRCTVARIYFPRERDVFLLGSNDASAIVPPPGREGEGSEVGVVDPDPEPSIAGAFCFALVCPITVAMDIAIDPFLAIGFVVVFIAAGGQIGPVGF
jgi:hypothetical protein